MRKYFRKTTVIGLALAGCLALSGCGSSSDSYNGTYNKTDSYEAEDVSDYGFDSYDESTVSENVQSAEYAEAEMAESVSETSAGDGSGASVKGTGDELSKKTAAANKKIIKTYNFSYDTEKFDEAYRYLREQVAAYDGYISSSDMYGTDLRNLRLTARIPVDKCDGFVNQLGSLGTVVSQSESAEDVTLQYNDTESRITSLKTEQQRINELLKEADSLETIITLEDRLTDIRYELENYQSQKNLYDDLITYCTVNISLSEVSYEVPVDDSTVLSRMKTGLVTSLRDIGYDFTNFIVWLVVSSPYLVIWALVIFVIYRIIRKIAKKNKAKRLAKQEAKQAAKAQQAVQQTAKVQQGTQNVKPQNIPVENKGNQPNPKSAQKPQTPQQENKENK